MSIIDKAKRATKYNSIIGNTIFDDNEYEELLKISRTLSTEFLNSTTGLPINRNHEIIFITLLEIIKRWKNLEDNADDNKFWEYIVSTILSLEKGVESQNIVTKLRKEYIRIMESLKVENSIIFAKEGKIYYATLLLHALASTKSIYAFLDLCYDIFSVDLNFNYSDNDKEICKIATSQFCKILNSSVGNEKPINIGTNIYGIKIGLRRLALDSETQDEFIDLIDEALKKINQLFHKQSLGGNSYFDKLINVWYHNNLVSIESNQKKNRSYTHFVSKGKINVKFVHIENTVYLVIPPIRLDSNSNNKYWLSVYSGNTSEQCFSKELFTKIGNKLFINTTVQEDINLNHLFKSNEHSIKLRVKIAENNLIIFDKIIERDFILFDDENEVLSKVIKVNNYFLYSRDLESLIKSTEITSVYDAPYLYNIYPKENDKLSGKTQAIQFLNIKKSLGNKNKISLNGELSLCKWSFENIEYSVFNKNISLLLPNDISTIGIELRVNKNETLLTEMKYEIFESYHIINISSNIPRNQPVELCIYSHHNRKEILKEYIIVLNSFDFSFNKKYYYGDDEKILKICVDGNEEIITWTNKENEIIYPYMHGNIILKIPYLKWRIGNKKWHNEPLFENLWYKDSKYGLHNGSILEIDADFETEKYSIFAIADYNYKDDINKKETTKYEFGRYIFQNEGKKELLFFLAGLDAEKKYELLRIYINEHFYSEPLSYSDYTFFWRGKNSFVGDETRRFKLEIYRNKAEPVFYGELSLFEDESVGIEDGIYYVVVSSKSDNIFSNDEKIWYKKEFIIGPEEKFRFINKKIKLIAANFAYNGSVNINEQLWNCFRPEYYFDNIKYVEYGDEIFYLGNLYTLRPDGSKKYLNEMKDDTNNLDNINPVRIDIRTDNELEILAGFDKNDYSYLLEALYYDKERNSICNKTEIKNRYRYISRYKYEVQNV